MLFGCDSGKVYAVACDSGKPVWEVAAAAEVWTSPVIRDGVVFFGSADCRVYALDVDTGRKRWTQELGGRIYSTACVETSSIFISAAATARSTVSMSRPAKRYGAPQRETASTPHPAVAGNTVLIGSEDFFFYALDANTGVGAMDL